MELRVLSMQNFRGIERLRWTIPQDKKIICMIGPGDSGKTTVLEAISWLLSDKWYVPVTVADFKDEGSPIVIEGFVASLPQKLVGYDAWGLSLCSLDADGEVHEPTDDSDRLALLRLTVEWDSFEPRWEVIPANEGQPRPARPGERRLLGAATLGQQVDSELRWGSSSGLKNMTKQAGGVGFAEREVIVTASHALRDEELPPDLQAALANVKGNAETLGAGKFEDLRPGLDLSGLRGTGLSLYSGDIPLSSYGLGSRRLAALSIEKAAISDKSTFLIDEIETGLEPHRVVGLVEAFRRDKSVSQVFMTTHSPAAVESCDASELVVVVPGVKGPALQFLPGELQGLHRTNPSAFLARKIIVTEGDTEEGMIRAAIRYYDTQRRSLSKATSASHGVALCNGGGGDNACTKALRFRELGFGVFLMVDGDDPVIDEKVSESVSRGVVVCRWEPGADVERTIISRLTRSEVFGLLKETISREIATKEAIVASLNKVGVSVDVDMLLHEDQWAKFDDDELRDKIAKASTTKPSNKKHEWYKTIAAGDFLGRWLLGDGECAPGSGSDVTEALLGALVAFVYDAADEDCR